MNDKERAWLDDVFEYHAPTAVQVVIYANLRGDAKAFASTVIEHCPPSADRSATLRLIREAVMTANASVALAGRG